ncbi:MAG TPA: hypothetical protein VFY75_05915 [Solirubrobacterales bacterium]|nr:hypothetical protein [Solirubrobacterales bacterium]
MVVAIGIALLAKSLYPADLPESRNPDFVDNVFANRAVLWAARLLLVSAAGVLGLGGLFSRLAIERADARMREFRRQAAIHSVTTDRLLQALEEAVRRK